MLIKSVNGKTPLIPEDCYVAENATIVGDVSFGESCSVWFNAVIRGDVNFIQIGNKIFRMERLFIARIKASHNHR
jgi:carbonic anhydrase/acetyltransferase-like protein (isoleucine patch superfamily)